MELILGLVGGLLAGIGAGIVLRRQFAERKVNSAESQAQEVLRKAEADAESKTSEALADAKRRANELRSQTDQELTRLRAELERREETVAGLEEAVESRTEALDAREQRLESREQRLLERQNAIEQQKERLAELEGERRQALESVARISAQEAKAQLVAEIEEEAKRDALAIVRDFEARAREEAERRARKIVVTAIQRLGAEQAQESSVSILQIPSDDMKGRIIGREGRNIRHFEQITGANLVIDDTPEAVVLSCFDPVRREVARITLEALVADGRIHPARIEEEFDRARHRIDEEVKEAGEEAVHELGLTNVHPELVRALGRLRFRYSYGQNVLRHVVEASHIAGMIAGELGSDAQHAKRCTVFHDIGKAVAHEVEGTHAHVGAELARRLGESPAVCHAIEAHHNEIEPKTLEAVICQAADAISGARPGARRESFEAYVQRLERLEELAKSFDGVEKVYAMQAGREVRVMVSPEEVDDVSAQVLAREIAKRVEEELQYPGQIKVTVLREIRSVEYAR